MTLRVLGALRLSQDTEDSMSIKGQRAAIQHWADAPNRDAQVVAWSEDTDVSGGMSPFKRPGLGQWFTEEGRRQWDVLAILKVDRLSRKASDFYSVIDWADKNGKSIVSVTEGIDMSTGPGKMFAGMLAVFAEGELDAIKFRVNTGIATRLKDGVWVGGMAPFGYEIVRKGDGAGKWLSPVEPYASLAREIADRFLEGQSLRSIAQDINTRGLPPWLSVIRPSTGKARASTWSGNSIRQILLNPKIAGYFTYKDEVVEDEEGNPVMITAAPLLDGDTWSRVKLKFADNKPFSATPTRSKALLVGLSKCGACGRPLTKSEFSNKKERKDGRITLYKRYRCNNYGSNCPNAVYMDSELLEDVFTESFMDNLGDKPVMRRVSVDLIDVRPDIIAAEARLARLEADYVAGKYDSDEMETVYWSTLKAQAAKLARLKSQERAYEDNRDKYESTGQTFSEVWASKDAEQRQMFLKEHGVKVWVYRKMVTWSKHSVVIQWGDMPAMVKAAGLLVDDEDWGSIAANTMWQVPTSQPLTVPYGPY